MSNHKHCVFCGTSSEAGGLVGAICVASDNPITPDTVGNRPHAFLADNPAAQPEARPEPHKCKPSCHNPCLLDDGKAGWRERAVAQPAAEPSGVRDAEQWLDKQDVTAGPHMYDGDWYYYRSDFVWKLLTAYAECALAQVREERRKLQRYLDHDPKCPEFRQKANRHNQGVVEDSAWPCTCGLTALLSEKETVKK
jgi:hypothetical protein